jgi:hypothetical protein
VKPTTFFLAPVLACALLLLVAALPVAHAGTLSLDLSTACIHNKTEARRDLNQVNPGLGVEYQFTPDVGLAGGFYRNSFKRASVYALIEWTPLHADLPLGLTASLGVTGGLVSGYSHVNPFAPFAGGALVKLRAADGWGVNVVAAPNIAASSGFVGLQLVVSL